MGAVDVSDPTPPPHGIGDVREEHNGPVKGEEAQRLFPSDRQPSAHLLCVQALSVLVGTPWGAELRLLLPSAVPLMLSSGLGQLMSIADLFFVGRMLGPEYLAAAALGNAWANQLSALFLGVTVALEEACTSSWRGGHPSALGLHLQRALVAVLVVSVPLIVVALTATDTVLTRLGLSVDLSERASGFNDALMLGIAPLALATACTRFLWSQGVIWPALLVDGVANALNVSLNALLINIDGFLGAPLATSVSRCAHLLLIATFLWRWSARGVGTWTGWALRDAVREKEMGAFAVASLLGVFRVALETWPVEWSTLLAGGLDVPSLDAHVVLLNTVLFLRYTLPSGLGNAAAMRINALLGAGDVQGARRTSATTLCTAAAFNVLAGSVLLALGGRMGDVFTKSSEVTGRVGAVAATAAVFQAVDGYNAALSGVLRGVGHDKAISVAVFVGWSAVGLPTATTLARHWGWGLPGLWLGLLAGVATVSLLLTYLHSTVDWVSVGRAGQSSTAVPLPPRERGVLRGEGGTDRVEGVGGDVTDADLASTLAAVVAGDDESLGASLHARSPSGNRAEGKEHSREGGRAGGGAGVQAGRQSRPSSLRPRSSGTRGGGDALSSPTVSSTTAVTVLE